MYRVVGKNGATCKVKGRTCKSRSLNIAADVGIFLLGRRLSDWDVYKNKRLVKIPDGMCDVREIAEFLAKTPAYQMTEEKAEILKSLYPNKKVQ